MLFLCIYARGHDRVLITSRVMIPKLKCLESQKYLQNSKNTGPKKVENSWMIYEYLKIQKFYSPKFENIPECNTPEIYQNILDNPLLLLPKNFQIISENLKFIIISTSTASTIFQKIIEYPRRVFKISFFGSFMDILEKILRLISFLK